MRKLVGTLGVVALLTTGLVALGATPAEAAIVVNTTDDENNNDGDCSLREAVETVNSGVGVDACPAGMNDIELAADTYPLNSQLPLTTSITIFGAGADATTIDCGAAGGTCMNQSGPGATTTIESLTMANSTGNHVNHGFGAGTLTFNDAVIRDGGSTGFNTGDSDIVVNRSTVSGNDGGGFNTADGTVTVVDSTVSGNGSTGVNTSSGPVSVDRSTIAGNDNTGVNTFNANIDVVNSTFTGNGGGGINTSSGLVTINSSDFVGNEGNAVNSGDAGITFTNSILAANTGGNCGVAVTSGGHNISDDDTCAFAEVGDRDDLDPEIGPLADNGGPTDTFLPQDGSPAIDQGGDCPDVDQRGEPRPASVDGDPDPVCDIGSVELQPPDPDDPITPTDGGPLVTPIDAATPAGAVTSDPSFTG